MSVASSRSISASRDTSSFQLAKNFDWLSTFTRETTVPKKSDELKVLGLDLSLSCTGIVVLTHTSVKWKAVKTKRLNELPKRATSAMWNGVFYGNTEDRITFVVLSVFQAWTQVRPQLVCVEDYAFSRHSRALTPLHELGGVVKHYLSIGEILWLPVGSTESKKYATGKGTASKPQMLARARQLWPGCPKIFDVADAFHVARFGLRERANLIQSN